MNSSFAADGSRNDRSLNGPPLSKLGIRILRSELEEASLKIVGLTLQCRELSHLQLESRKSFDGINCNRKGSEVQNNWKQQLLNRPTIPIYKELYDSASSIVTDILRRPRLIIDAMACISPASNGNLSFGQTKVGFIALNRILHPYFSDTSATTLLLLEAITYQTTKCQQMDRIDNGSSSSKRKASLSHFINNSSLLDTWNPLTQPLPVTPNVSSETLLTTVLKLYAVRVDVTIFFRELWKPVLPSIVAIISKSEVDDSSLNSLVKVAVRLLSHTFSEKSIIMFPPTAVAVSRAIHAISGTEGVCMYLFDLLVLPNLVKVLSMAEYDFKGGDVLKQFHACYSQSTWWSDKSPSAYSPVNSLIWVVWRLFSGAVGITGLPLSTLSTRAFFSSCSYLDTSSMPDQRLQYILSTLGRAVLRSCRLIVHLPLDMSGCEWFNVDAVTATGDLKAALPQLADTLDARLISLLKKPQEMLQSVVISRYEVAVLFDAASAAITATLNRNEGDGKQDDLKSLLREEIASYNILEQAIEQIVPLSSQPVSEQMVLQLLSGPAPEDCPDQEIRLTYQLLSGGLQLASTYEAAMQVTLDKMQHGAARSIIDLLEGCDPCRSPDSLDEYNMDSHTPHAHHSSSPMSMSQDRSLGPFQASTESSALKVTQPHRGLAPAAKPLERMEQQQAEDDEVARKKAERLATFLRGSQATSPYTGSRYTKIDDDMASSSLLQQTESRAQYMRPDTAPMTSRDHEKLFNHSLRSQVSSSMDFNSNSQSRRRADSPQSLSASLPSRKISQSSPGQRKGSSSDIWTSNGRRMAPHAQSLNSSQYAREKNVKPFPEHLRGQMRHEHESLPSPSHQELESMRNIVHDEYENPHAGDQRLKAQRPRTKRLDPQPPLSDSQHSVRRTFNPARYSTEFDFPPSDEEQVGGLEERGTSPSQRTQHFSRPRSHGHDPYSSPDRSSHKGLAPERQSRDQSLDRNRSRDDKSTDRNLHGEYYDGHQWQQQQHGNDSDHRGMQLYPPTDQHRSDRTDSANRGFHNPRRMDVEHHLTNNYLSASPLSPAVISSNSRGRGRGSTQSPVIQRRRSRSATSGLDRDQQNSTRKGGSARCSPSPDRRTSRLDAEERRGSGSGKSVRGSLESPTWRPKRPPSPSFTQPPFKPAGGASPARPLSGWESFADVTSPGYRAPSPSSRGSEKPTRRRYSSDEEMRSISRESLMTPSRPPEQRISSARPTPSYKTSPSTLSDTPSKFLSDLHSGITPGLREYEGHTRGRPVFRPSGNTENGQIPMDDYDGKIDAYLTRNLIPQRELQRLLDGSPVQSGMELKVPVQYVADSAGRELGKDGSELTARTLQKRDASANLSDSDRIALLDAGTAGERSPPSPPSQPWYDLDHDDIRAAAQHVVLNMSCDQSYSSHPEHSHDEDEGGEDDVSMDVNQHSVLQEVDQDQEDDEDPMERMDDLSSFRHLQMSLTAFNLPLPVPKSIHSDADSLEGVGTSDLHGHTTNSSTSSVTDNFRTTELGPKPFYAYEIGMAEMAVRQDLGQSARMAQQDKALTRTALQGLQSAYFAEDNEALSPHLARSPVRSPTPTGAKELLSARPNSLPVQSQCTSPASQSAGSEQSEVVSSSLTESPASNSRRRSPSLSGSTKEPSILPGSKRPSIPRGKSAHSPRNDSSPLAQSPVRPNATADPSSPADHALSSSKRKVRSEASELGGNDVSARTGHSDSRSPPTSAKSSPKPSAKLPARPLAESSNDSSFSDVTLQRDRDDDGNRDENPFLAGGRQMLKQGIPVMKRGRRGRPKRKMIKLLEDSSVLEWTPIEERNEALAEGPRRNCFSGVCAGRSASKDKGEGKGKRSSIQLKSITDILDRSSTYMEKDRIRNMLKNLGPSCCLLVTKERTLDLTFRNAEEMSLITETLKEMIKEKWLISAALKDMIPLPDIESISISRLPQ